MIMKKNNTATKLEINYLQCQDNEAKKLDKKKQASSGSRNS